MSEQVIKNRECQACGDYYTLRPECEPTAYCDLCAQTMLYDALAENAKLKAELERAMRQNRNLLIEQEHEESVRKELQYQTEQAQKACAEMRDVLNQFEWEDAMPYAFPAMADWERALSSDCGRDYAHKNRIRCMYCNKEYSVEQGGELADHIMSCDKSPMVQMVKEMETRITDYMDLMNDEFMRIVSITDNTEIAEICQRAMIVIAQKEPVLKQRDDAQKQRDQFKAQVEQLREALGFLGLKESGARAIAFHVLQGEPFGGITKEALAKWLYATADEFSKVQAALETKEAR